MLRGGRRRPRVIAPEHGAAAHAIPHRHDARRHESAVRPRAVGALRRVLALLWFVDARRAAARASRRGPLRRDRARDGGDRRLGDAAPQRPQVFREAAVPVLDDGGRLSRVRRARVDGAPVARARGLPRRAGDRCARATPWAGASLGAYAGLALADDGLARRHRADRHARFRTRVLSRAGLRRARGRPARRSERRASAGRGCGSPGPRWRARRCRRG